MNVPRRSFTKAAQGQRLELGQRSLPEKTKYEERREEAPESWRHRDDGKGEERTGRCDEHHPLARAAAVGCMAP